MTHTYHSGPHSREVWSAVADTLRAIEELPFLAELAAGTLDARAFTNYILQDEIYLVGYAKAMTILASRAPATEQTRFWAEAAGLAVYEEQQMHAQLLGADRLGPHVDDLTGGTGVPTASPTTLGYTSYLVAQAATAPYEVGVAAVLPCFWVYAHMGKVLTAAVGDRMADHPYREWIETYDSPEFDAAVDGAVAIYEGLAEDAGPAVRKAMVEAFRQATVYECSFWDSAHVIEGWDASQT
ncbi:TenA family protein [Brevibacterium ihuae]|uniref:TenA family protein n=1 Tax=Brevibacterium ihuae TaxID=1631743 RepID=UPI000C78E950|nr:TenA family protein [Brevibacterium ihuae]